MFDPAYEAKIGTSIDQSIKEDRQSFGLTPYEQLLTDFCEKKYTTIEISKLCLKHGVNMSRYAMNMLAEATGDEDKIEGLDLMNFFEDWDLVLNGTDD